MEKQRDIDIELALLLYGLNILDAVLTLFAMSTGEFVELNPIMELTLHNGFFIPIKIFLAPALIFALFWWVKRRGNSITKALILLVSIYTVVCVSNALILLVGLI